MIHLSYKILIFSTMEKCTIESSYLITVTETTHEFIDEYYYTLSAKQVALYCNQNKVCGKYFTNFDWGTFSERKDLSASTLNLYVDKLYWGFVSRNNANLTLKTIRKFNKYIDFGCLSINKNLNYNVASHKMYKLLLNPKLFDLYHLDERIAQLFIRHIDVDDYIVKNKKISHGFMKKNLYRMNKQNRDAFLKGIFYE